ncbi:hypothetical protein U5640_25500 [Streptomyces sp. SS7]
MNDLRVEVAGGGAALEQWRYVERYVLDGGTAEWVDLRLMPVPV